MLKFSFACLEGQKKTFNRKREIKSCDCLFILGIILNLAMEHESENMSDDDILPEARVFEFRAHNIVQSKLQAFEELFNKAPEDLEELKEDEEDIEKVGKKTRKPRVKKAKAQKKEKLKDEVKKTQPKRSRRRAMPKKDANPSRNKRATPEKEDEDASPRREATPEDDCDEDYRPSTHIRRGRKKDADEKKSVDPEEIISSVKLPAGSKRRIQELELNSDRHKRRIDIENERILSACNDKPTEELLPISEDTEQSIMLKIRFLSDISKIEVNLAEKFASILEKVGEMHNLQASEILLCVRDQTIKPTDTPLSLNLKYFEIIDCLPYKPSDNITEDSTGNFFLKMQSYDTTKKTEVYGSKYDKFGLFMKQYAEMRNIPLNKLSFEFDGEKIDESETPEGLEIENGSCIDVRIATENASIAEDSLTTKSDSDVEITAEVVSESNRLQVCEVD